VTAGCNETRTVGNAVSNVTDTVREEDL